jgi:hypothetical protein
MYIRCGRAVESPDTRTVFSAEISHDIPLAKCNSEETTNHELVELFKKFVVQLDGLFDRLDDEIVAD